MPPQKLPPPDAVTVPGNALTVTLAVAIQPVGSVYVITAVPGPAPMTLPDSEPAVAMAVAPELHIPPVVLLLKTVAEPAHTVVIPVMAAGNPLTVTVLTDIQPVGRL